MPKGAPEDIAAIRRAISAFLNETDDQGRIIGNAHGVYAFYDYDGEPIYVGQTAEGLRTRIRRHLTNQRTDAVAMNVLDPFEVSDIELWPLRWSKPSPMEKKEFEEYLNQAEYSVFQQVLRTSSFQAVLNEKTIAPVQTIPLPTSYRRTIVPEGIYRARSHPDVRIARRALTIARLAQVISERNVSVGLRRTLVTQARRLEQLATSRYNEYLPFDESTRTDNEFTEPDEES